MVTTVRRFWIAALLPVVAAGCGGGPTFSQEELERARQALQTSLDSWKRGDLPEKLRGLPEPIEFAEEGPKTGLKLLDYQVLGTENTDTETMRFTVTLNVQDRRGRREQRHVTYAVALKSPIAVGRDPFF